MFSCIQKLYQADHFSNVLESIGYVHQYQPIVSAVDCRVLGYESLIRKPIAGHTDHAESILKSAKDNESSEYFDYFAFRSCCDKARENSSYFFTANINAATLCKVAWLDLLIYHVQKKPLLQCNICIEIVDISESTNQTVLLKASTALHSKGSQFAIDNYGESWSCLELVRSAPIKWLKLSRQSILDLETFPKGQLFRVHKAVVDVCVNRDIGVICQGIETARQESIARQIGATLLQGFRYGKPNIYLSTTKYNTEPKALIL